MGLLDGLMPGESMGMPNGMGGQPDKMSGLLNNPALQMGLGILANNQGNYGSFGAALGRGGLTGMQNLQRQQESMRQQELMKLREKQIEQAYGMNQAEFEQNKSMRDQQETAHNDFDTKFPEYKGLSRLNPQAAMKIAYPQATGADPYFTPIPLENGLASFNNRTGKMQLVTLPNGQTVMKASDSPSLQGRIQGAKSQAQAQWKPNTDIPGVVSTDAQVAGAASGGVPLPSYQGNTPYPMSWNKQPMGAPGTTQMDAIEGDANIQLRDPARPQRSALGLTVPTPAENKALEIKAEAAAKSQIELPKVIDQANQTYKLMDDLISHPGLKTAVGLSSKLDPRNYMAGTDAADFKVRLDQLQGQQFLQAFESLKGGGQITEVEGKKATDAMARMNTSQTEAEFFKSAKEFQSVIKAGIERSKVKAGGGIMPTNEAMPKNTQMFNELPKPNQFKGKIIRDDVTGKRFQSNGLQWKEVK